ncbi:MAG: CHAT domain-containing protein [Candidatus Omnitrophica bacterium]|nr:CHAT domain-containing protein [Candidatus Omnitrophota bacterium]
MNSRAVTLEAITFPKHIQISLYGDGATIRRYYQVKISLKEIAQLCADIIDLLNQSAEAGKKAPYIAANLQKTGQLLFDQLLPDAVKDGLAATKANTLTLVLDDRLAEVPWELLFDGQQFLSLRFNIGRILKTTEDISPCPARKTKFPQKMLILADPTNNLPAARVEAMVVGDVIEKKPDWVHLSSKVIGISRLYLKKNMRGFDALHYAGHARYDAKNAKNSGWLLNDGTLTVSDIRQMAAAAPFPALVFSNSCDSAMAKTGYIDQTMEKKCLGLATAFLASGTRYFIGSLWKLSDEAALFFAREFYKQLLQGRAIGEAVRRARTYLIRNYGTGNIAWASYVLYGDPAKTLFPKR